MAPKALAASILLLVLVIGSNVLELHARGGGRDFYGILGVDRGADEATIKKAYRKQASPGIISSLHACCKSSAPLSSPLSHLTHTQPTPVPQRP